jgi:mannosyl-oligosaccharide glucosidase
MKPTGWIPREQIRGPEAESVVPEFFIPQIPDVANPPSMVFPLKFLTARAKSGESKLQTMLQYLYTRFQMFYEFYKTSQGNPGMDYTYSWRDKNENGCLGSGLDDYPRGYVTNDRKEIHLDLQAWMV